jgi:putative addiction module component (TIGR02574 family)
MTPRVERIEAELLDLPTEDRARIAERLIASLDQDAESDTAWRAEVERRLADLDGGTVGTVSLDETISEIERSL